MPANAPPLESQVSGLTAVWEKIKVVATSLPTWLAIASAVISQVADELIKVLPDEIDAQVVTISGQLVAWLAAAGAIVAGAVLTIRRLTPVPEAERGILPQSPDPTQ